MTFYFSDHKEIILAFNKHFVAAAYLFEDGEFDSSPTLCFSQPSVSFISCLFKNSQRCSHSSIDPRKCTKDSNVEPFFLRLTEQINSNG